MQNIKKMKLKKYFTLSIIALILGSCTKDLDREPFYGLNSLQVYKSPEGYKSVLAKVYANLSLTGQAGPAGNADIQGIDEGSSDFLRLYWEMQELTTDEAVVAWNDPGIPNFHQMDWSSDNVLIQGFYNRLFYQITLCNEFIRESSDEKLTTKGFTEAQVSEIKTYRAEVRLLRAYAYSIALDLFGNVPFITEESAIGATLPEQIFRPGLFAYVESELLALEGTLVPPMQNEYGRMDQTVAWMLLARLYLNAEVYIGEARYTEALNYAKKVIDAGYELEPDYRKLFMADNHTLENGIIYSIPYDGVNALTYGGTTFLVHASVGGSMKAADYGVNGGWAGLRTTKALPNQFTDVTGATDERAMFYTDGQNLEIEDIGSFADGYAVTKFVNIRADGGTTHDPNFNFVDTDFPLFRLGEAYLIYAEAVLRGADGGSVSQAVQYINLLRQRAYNDASGNISAADLTLDFILDERAREMYWEAQRRTDLIRYGRFTGNEYLWPWKGNVPEGRAVEDFRTLFPIPSSDLTANPNLVQNQGY